MRPLTLKHTHGALATRNSQALGSASVLHETRATNQFCNQFELSFGKKSVRVEAEEWHGVSGGAGRCVMIRFVSLRRLMDPSAA